MGLPCARVPIAVSAPAGVTWRVLQDSGLSPGGWSVSRLCRAASGRAPSDHVCVHHGHRVPSMGQARPGPDPASPAPTPIPPPPHGQGGASALRPLGSGQHRSEEAAVSRPRPKVPGASPQALGPAPFSDNDRETLCLREGTLLSKKSVFCPCVRQLRSCQRPAAPAGGGRAVAMRRLSLNGRGQGRRCGSNQPPVAERLGTSSRTTAPVRLLGLWTLPAPPAPRPALAQHQAAACGLGRRVEGRGPQLSGGASA